MISIRNFHNGYSVNLFKKMLGDFNTYILIGPGLRDQNQFDSNNHPTDKVVAKRVDLYFKGAGTQSIKLPASFKLDPSIKDMSKVKLINPSAIQVKSKIYLKADGIKEATK